MSRISRWLGGTFGLGFAIAALPLVWTNLRHTTTGGTYELGSIHFAVWWILLSVAAAFVAMGRLWAGALAGAGVLELGFMTAFVLDVAYSISVGIPHTIWPIAIILVLVLTTLAAVLGALVGALIGKGQRRKGWREGSLR